MGTKRDKGMAVTRYLTGSTGIPFMSWNGGHSQIDAPYPYMFRVSTARSISNWADQIREIEGDMPRVCIRYDGDIPDVSHAWVGMKLMGFVPLLTAHYEHNIAPRMEKE